MYKEKPLERKQRYRRYRIYEWVYMSDRTWLKVPETISSRLAEIPAPREEIIIASSLSN